MLLAIDSGNTNIVFAVFDNNGNIKMSWRATSKQERTADEFGIWLTQLMALENMKPEIIEDAIISSVVPSSEYALKTLCRKYFKCTPIMVNEQLDLGIEVRIDNPASLGADRLVDTFEAHLCYEGDLLVLDFGTATTLDVIDSDGNYIGGSIAPGVNLSVEALHKAAALLPKIAVKCPEKVIGKNTLDAMAAGVFWGYIGMIEGLVNKTKEEYARPMKVIATGGLAPLFAEYTDVIEKIDSDLTLRGLYSIYKRLKR